MSHKLSSSLLFAAVLTACSSTTVVQPAPAPADPTDEDAGTTGGDAATGGSDASADAAAGPMTLTSPEFTEGGAFPKASTCDGADTSPALTWTPGPAGTKSYAIAFNDVTISYLHGVMYDIPATTTALPANVEKAYAPSNAPGAKQTKSFRSTVTGYAGPCARAPSTHTYEFILYALSVETLAGATEQSTRDQVFDLIDKKPIVLATTRLTGTYTR
ncbi:MAG: YbhB/YbcL family Raf kinase inhibitor-like protein [Myxococcales bacterium]|nr:YbhB/YbcL family Raf kinase inhibitor-like protein [Myxococcales bacterium]